jgi:hypothetical protein
MTDLGARAEGITAGDELRDSSTGGVESQKDGSLPSPEPS